MHPMLPIHRHAPRTFAGSVLFIAAAGLAAWSCSGARAMPSDHRAGGEGVGPSAGGVEAAPAPSAIRVGVAYRDSCPPTGRRPRAGHASPRWRARIASRPSSSPCRSRLAASRQPARTRNVAGARTPGRAKPWMPWACPPSCGRWISPRSLSPWRTPRRRPLPGQQPPASERPLPAPSQGPGTKRQFVSAWGPAFRGWFGR
jgi:hypothetical protein